MATRKLRGMISEGMFPNERVFLVSDHGGSQHAVIVSEDLIEDSTVRVRVLESVDGLSLVEVPGEHLDAARTISVRDTELEPVG
jgi:hypothetical protein